MKKVSGTRRLLAVVLTVAMLLQNSAGVLATDGANAISNLQQEQSTEQLGVGAVSEQTDANAASNQTDEEVQDGAGTQGGENTDVPKDTAALETDAPQTNVPETAVPETQIPQTDVPQTDASETQVPQTNVPQAGAPETNVADTTASQTDAPKTEGPETVAPEADVPQTEAPQMQGSSETQEMPSLTLPDGEKDNETNDTEPGVGTETGGAAETNAAGTNSTGTEAAESGNDTGAEAADGGSGTIPAETTAPEQAGTADDADIQAAGDAYTEKVENTTVEVKVQGGDVLPEDGAMTARKITDVSELGQMIAERLHEEGQALLGVEAFDITLLDGNGKELHQLDGKVLVEMKGLTVPEDAEQIRVYHMTEEGQPEQVKVLAKEELTDGVLRFENDRFSVYAVAYVKGEDLNAGIMPIAGSDINFVFEVREIKKSGNTGGRVKGSSSTDEKLKKGTKKSDPISVTFNSKVKDIKNLTGDVTVESIDEGYYFLYWAYGDKNNINFITNEETIIPEQMLSSQGGSKTFVKDATFTAWFAPYTSINVSVDKPTNTDASVNTNKITIQNRFVYDENKKAFNNDGKLCTANSGTEGGKGAAFKGWQLKRAGVIEKDFISTNPTLKYSDLYYAIKGNTAEDKNSYRDPITEDNIEVVAVFGESKKITLIRKCDPESEKGNCKLDENASDKVVQNAGTRPANTVICKATVSGGMALRGWGLEDNNEQNWFLQNTANLTYGDLYNAVNKLQGEDKVDVKSNTPVEITEDVTVYVYFDKGGYVGFNLMHSCDDIIGAEGYLQDGTLKKEGTTSNGGQKYDYVKSGHGPYSDTNKNFTIDETFIAKCKAGIHVFAGWYDKKQKNTKGRIYLPGEKIAGEYNRSNNASQTMDAIWIYVKADDVDVVYDGKKHNSVPNADVDMDEPYRGQVLAKMDKKLNSSTYTKEDEPGSELVPEDGFVDAGNYTLTHSMTIAMKSEEGGTAGTASEGTTATATSKIIIRPRPVELYVEGDLKYDGTEQTLTFHVTNEDIVEADKTEKNPVDRGLLKGHELTATVSIKGQNVGTYEDVTYTDLKILDESGNDVTSNYDVTIKGKLTITKGTGSGKVQLDNWTYGDTPAEEQAEMTGGDYVISPTYYYTKKGEANYTTERPTQAGQYTVKAVWSATDNCEQVEATDDFELFKRSITVSKTERKIHKKMTSSRQ